MFALTRLTISRARKERLPQIAGSLSFTTVLSVVPFIAVSFALFTWFPVFGRFERALEDHLLRGLLPTGIARPVLETLGRFAANAGGLTAIGLLLLLASAIALLLTVENAFNQIWGVKRQRPFLKRVGLYALLLAAGPPALGVSLWATSYVLSASMGLIGPLPASAHYVLNLAPVLLTVAALSGVFYFIPNTRVRRLHACIGGLIAGVALEAGKRGFATYVLTLPTYEAVYGAFWTVPVFLLWVYFSWLVILAAALLTASLARRA